MLEVELEAGLLAQAKHLRILGDAVDTEVDAEVVKEYIAGLHQCPAQIDRAVAAVLPAAEGLAAKGVVARAEEGGIGIDQTFLKAGDGDDRLIGRTGHINATGGLVEKGLKRIGDQ